MFSNNVNGQSFKERRIIITDVNETEVIRKDTTVSIHADVDRVLTTMGYDPMTIALAASTKVGRQITIETTEIDHRNAELEISEKPVFRGRTSEEVIELIDMVNNDLFLKDSSELGVITKVEPGTVITQGKSLVYVYGLKDFQEFFPVLKVTVSELDKEELEMFELSREVEEEALNISNFRIKPDYPIGKYRMSFNHFGAGKTNLRIYDSEEMTLLYEEDLPGNHFDYPIEFMLIESQHKYYVVCTKDDYFFAKSVELDVD